MATGGERSERGDGSHRSTFAQVKSATTSMINTSTYTGDAVAGGPRRLTWSAFLSENLPAKWERAYA
jgi:hypothetical protein